MFLIRVLLAQVMSSWGFLTPLRYGINEERFEKCPSGAEPQRSREGNIVWCKNSTDCTDHHSCSAIEGLLHFGTQIRYCCPTRMSTCLLHPQPGYGECGKKPKKMYYFDATRLQCLPFKVLECLGTNENRFNTAEECAEQCEKTACQPGESMLMEAGEPRLCGTTLCPSNYVCRYDALFRRHVCCGYSTTGACAAGYRTYMSTTKGVPAQCTINYIKDGCPTDFLCASSSDSRNAYCCSLENGVCPLGQTPYYHPLTSKTVKCNPSSGLSDCPDGFTCSATVVGAIWGFCCSQHITAQCPRSSLPYTNPVTGEPQKCTVGVTVCGAGFECMNRNSNLLIGFCCTVETPAATKKKLQTRKPSNSNVNKNNRRNLGNTNEYEKAKASTLQRTTALPFYYNTKQLRIIDIQKEIDRQNTLKDKKLRTLAQYGGFRSMDDEIKCPITHHQVAYEDGTIIECHLFKKCPAGLECVSPQGGFMDKSICCERRMEMDDEYDKAEAVIQKYGSTFSSTSEDRYCVPGDANYCPEPGFFCQFNVIRQEFMCCSMDSP